MSSTTLCTTVRFLNGDLVMFPYPSNAHDDLIDAICEMMSTTSPTPLHPLQVALCSDEREDREEKKNDVLTALIFPKKRVSLHEFPRISDTKVDFEDFEALDLETMTNESVIGHLLSQPITDIPHRLFANPHPLVVDFLHSSGIFRLDQTDEWFRVNMQSNNRNGHDIFSNLADRVANVFDKIDPELLMEEYILWKRRGAKSAEVFFALTAQIMTHPRVTEEMICVIADDYVPHRKSSKEDSDSEKIWRYVRHRPEIKSHTLTELLCDLQYTDVEVVFNT